ncbi:AAA family ATPase [Staphylococcus hominis]|uniref:AAA family ATPase n=1 Tax=Staphylococcus hominis TaxID=1290 RepID=UPI001F5AFE2D|nr:AAA family ATPase [Staphylococcus hominis]MCI2871129.1 AAA family ATPase [Staphylococcus hominis]MCI2875376.1 AAA family ATPase [Staphylococcus hominis]MCI2890322.1 AAA family ATPase [Staphylococcus hominis]
MGRIIKVGDGFLKTTLTNAITNAQYGDTILIDNINFNKETMSFFEIPKGMDIKITSIDSEKKSLSGFKFLIKGNLSVSNVTLNSEEKHVVFDIDQGSLELDNISFNKMFSKFHKTAISNNGGNLLIKNSITLCPYSTNGTVVIENSTIYGGTLSIKSKWSIFNCTLYNNYFKYQWNIKENSEINIKHSEVIAYTNLLSDSTASVFLINNSSLYLDNSYFDYSDPSDSKNIYLLELAFGGQAKINNSEVTKIGMGKKAYLEANVLKTSSLATTNNSTIIIEKLNLNNKFNEEMYFRFHYSKGKIKEVISNLNPTDLYLLNSSVTIDTYNIPNNFNVFLQDKNSSIKSNKELNIKKLFNDEKLIKKTKSESQEIEKKSTKKESIPDPMNQLNDLIGLSNAKKQAKDFINVHVVNEVKKKKGIKVGDNSLHSIYKGNPGTGKTTVARLIAKILYQKNVIKKDLLVEVTRQDLVAGFIGQTAIKTEKVLKSALGGVLFIDEAYTLYSKSENDYGIEAIETILKFMEDNRGNIMIIFAGYPKEMDELMSINPGLESRIKNEIIFDDYTINELCLIGKKLLNEYEFNENIYDEKLKEVFKTQKINSNARFVRNFNDEIIKNQSNRLFDEDLIEIEYNIIRDIDITSI